MFNRMLIFPELALGFRNVFTATISRLRLHSKVMAQSFGACGLDWQPKIRSFLSISLSQFTGQGVVVGAPYRGPARAVRWRHSRIARETPRTVDGAWESSVNPWRQHVGYPQYCSLWWGRPSQFVVCRLRRGLADDIKRSSAPPKHLLSEQ